MSDKNNDVMLAVLLLGGAYMMTRRQMVTAVQTKPTSGGLISLPGNIGTGVGQALGGALGNLIGSWLKPGTSASTGGAGANGGGYLSDNESGSPSDWSLPIGTGDTTNGNWWDTIA